MKWLKTWHMIVLAGIIVLLLFAKTFFPFLLWLPALNINQLLFGWWPASWKEEVLLHDGKKIMVKRSQTRGGRGEVGQSPIKQHSITFTLIGVFFDEDAVTFDQAPFRTTAKYSSSDIDAYEYLLFTLQEHNEIDQSLLQPLVEYVDSMRQGNSDVLEVREQDVACISVSGDFLTNGASNALRIGRLQSPITHGGTDISGTDLHSMALLTAFLQNEGFRQVTIKLPDLLPLVR